MRSSTPSLPAPAPRFTVSGRGEGRAASLALLCARVRRVPGVDVLVDPRTQRRTPAVGGPVRLHLDVRGTGLSGYEIGRRMRKFSGVPVEFCEEHAVVAVFDDGDDLGAGGTRLLFALTHACSADAGAEAAAGR
jgi:hypothetical protein